MKYLFYAYQKPFRKLQAAISEREHWLIQINKPRPLEFNLQEIKRPKFRKFKTYKDECFDVVIEFQARNGILRRQVEASLGAVLTIDEELNEIIGPGVFQLRQIAYDGKTFSLRFVDVTAMTMEAEKKILEAVDEFNAVDRNVFQNRLAYLWNQLTHRRKR